MSGVETLQKIKVEIPEFDIPVIALTMNALTGMREKYLADGFNDYLAKPINKDELNRVINEYLNKINKIEVNSFFFLINVSNLILKLNKTLFFKFFYSNKKKLGG